MTDDSQYERPTRRKTDFTNDGESPPTYVEVRRILASL
jgi:hypothetical protein